jgi:hypothetical protein
MRRALVVAAGTLIVLGGIVALLLAFNARDDAGVSTGAATAGPGELQPDRGSAHTGSAPAASQLPTSGPHRPRAVTRDAQELTGDEILHALELGNVVLAYGSATPPKPLVDVQDAAAGPFAPQLAAAGQSVILARVPGVDGVAALAWRRILRTRDPADPALRDFVDAWLGTGAHR